MKEIDNIVKKVLSESLNEKADEITKKIQEKISGECMGGDCGEMEEGRFKNRLKSLTLDKYGEIPPSMKKKYFSDDEDETDVMSGEFDYVAETECMEGDCGETKEELHGNQKKIDVALPKGKITKADFDKLRSMKKEDTEMEEGNAFTKKLKDTPKGGKFKLGGKNYTDNSNLDESFKYSIQFDGEELVLTENELITMIEEIVLEEKKGNLKSPGKSKGMVEYDRVHRKDEDINKKANEESFKKMKDYVKAGSKGNFDPNPKMFPKGNGQLAKMNKKAYTPSDAVDEYIDAFSYPGQTNLVFDEIKPNDDRIEKYLKGHSTTGNAQVDKDGNPLGNVVPSEVGEKFFKNYQENLYGQEQQNASYKRQTQPVDQAGEKTESGTLKSKKGKKTAQGVLNKIEETYTNEKEVIKLTEEFVRMQNLMNYTKKTQ